MIMRQLSAPAANFFFRGLEKDGGINLFKRMDYSETCVNGMLLSLLSYFRSPDERVHSSSSSPARRTNGRRRLELPAPAGAPLIASF